eukprot:jgi/Botrbrau1/3497/Bobra.341_2s0027.1
MQTAPWQLPWQFSQPPGVPLDEGEGDDLEEEAEVTTTGRGRPTHMRAGVPTSAPREKKREVTARLLIDAMGHWSSIVKQMRGVQRPDGMLLVVGTCAEGIPQPLNQGADFLRTITDSKDDMQLFWEAFPAEGGGARTTYCFTYVDNDRRRPSLTELLDKYFELLPQYTGVPLSTLKVKRALFGGFPCYASTPLQTQFDRVLQVGDASAGHSPLSFGGFGSLLRQLPRLVEGISAALVQDKLTRPALAALQPYQPSLSCAWLFQRSMSLPMGCCGSRGAARDRSLAGVPPSHINKLMSANFRIMRALGDWGAEALPEGHHSVGTAGRSHGGRLLYRAPFDCAGPLLGEASSDTWVDEAFCLAGLYTVLYYVTLPLRRFQKAYYLQRWLDAFQYGSGRERRAGASEAAFVTATGRIRKRIGRTGKCTAFRWRKTAQAGADSSRGTWGGRRERWRGRVCGGWRPPCVQEWSAVQCRAKRGYAS